VPESGIIAIALEKSAKKNVRKCERLNPSGRPQHLFL
jgi:hypothetical protein